ncbi:MAG: hypothetical protein F4X98_15125 [Gammaproteobacteria bacterium]|nr:hypothetical protein [Gammaproteobacteria bacterium]
MANKDKDEPPIGSTALVQSCARMMSAAWLTREITETSTAPPKSISGTAYALRYTIASDMGMGFELALKALIQNLPLSHPVQVPEDHNLRLSWSRVPCDVRDEIDAAVERYMCSQFGRELKGRVLPFAKYLRKHNGFLNETVRNRYALQEKKGAWRSAEMLTAWRAVGAWITCSDPYQGRDWADGIGTLASYWYVIMRKVLDTRWPEPCADKEQALDLAVRAANQLLGHRYLPRPQAAIGNRQGDGWLGRVEEQ